MDLTTKAITTIDGRTSERVATLKLGARPVLRITGSMASWFLADLLDVKGPLAIDFGQGWLLVNVEALVAEAYALLSREGECS